MWPQATHTQTCLSFSRGESPRERLDQDLWGAPCGGTVPSSFQPISRPRLSPSAPPFLAFPACCLPEAPLLGASSCLTPSTPPCAPPAATHSGLQQVTLAGLCLLYSNRGCSSRCQRAELRTCLCPHTAEGGIHSPAMAPCCLPRAPWVQVLAKASLTPPSHQLFLEHALRAPRCAHRVTCTTPAPGIQSLFPRGSQSRQGTSGGAERERASPSRLLHRFPWPHTEPTASTRVSWAAVGSARASEPDNQAWCDLMWARLWASVSPSVKSGGQPGVGPETEHANHSPNSAIKRSLPFPRTLGYLLNVC